MICFITAIYGNYEASCKPFFPQTIDTTFICFTDNPSIQNNGWDIDTTPYHITHNPLDNGTFKNSIHNNSHTFNISKYYKQSFHNIPRLKKYDVIVWLDGTIEITYPNTSNYILNHIYKDKMIGWNHERRNGILYNEVKDASTYYKYNSTFWNNQSQPYQDVIQQYEEYVKDGYTDNYFKCSNPLYGVWITCFVAFLNTEMNTFLDLWYLHTLTYTTEDQVSFPFVVQKMKLCPHTLPNDHVYGDKPHDCTMFYIKHTHGI